MIREEIKSATLKELAARFGVPLKPFRKWMKKIAPKIGPRIGHFYNPRQVQKITAQYGATYAAIFAFFVNASDAFGRTFIPDQDYALDYNQPPTDSDDLVIDSTDSATVFNPMMIVTALLVFISMPVALYKLIRLSQQPIVTENFQANGSVAFNIQKAISRRALLITSCILVIVSGCVTVGLLGYWVGGIIF